MKSYEEFVTKIKNTLCQGIDNMIPFSFFIDCNQDGFHATHKTEFTGKYDGIKSLDFEYSLFYKEPKKRFYSFKANNNTLEIEISKFYSIKDNHENKFNNKLTINSANSNTREMKFLCHPLYDWNFQHDEKIALRSNIASTFSFLINPQRFSFSNSLLVNSKIGCFGYQFNLPLKIEMLGAIKSYNNFLYLRLPFFNGSTKEDDEERSNYSKLIFGFLIKQNLPNNFCNLFNEENYQKKIKLCSEVSLIHLSPLKINYIIGLKMALSSHLQILSRLNHNNSLWNRIRIKANNWFTLNIFTKIRINNLFNQIGNYDLFKYGVGLEFRPSYEF